MSVARELLYWLKVAAVLVFLAGGLLDFANDLLQYSGHPLPAPLWVRYCGVFIQAFGLYIVLKTIFLNR